MTWGREGSTRGFRRNKQSSTRVARKRGRRHGLWLFGNGHWAQAARGAAPAPDRPATPCRHRPGASGARPPCPPKLTGRQILARSAPRRSARPRRSHARLRHPIRHAHRRHRGGRPPGGRRGPGRPHRGHGPCRRAGDHRARRRRPHGGARRDRPAHALRRAALLGSVRLPVERARRHDRDRRQLRVHPRTDRRARTRTTSAA